MFKKLPIIEFAISLPTHETPKPAKTYLSDWYKKNSSKVHNRPIGGETLKQCVPFLDSMMAGYTATLWCDLLVTKLPNGQSQIEWKDKVFPEPIRIRELAGTEELPVPAGHLFQRYTWNIPYFTKTSFGYSCLFTHPINRFDLPFTTLTGIVDTHEVMYGGNLPFFLKEDFEGVIPKGTPMVQIIPFKNESWKSIENKKLIEEGRINERKSMAVFTGWYKNNVWKKKTYE
jgi:hypothetical protein